jgi:hypothetical protein
MDKCHGDQGGNQEAAGAEQACPEGDYVIKIVA